MSISDADIEKLVKAPGITFGKEIDDLLKKQIKKDWPTRRSKKSIYAPIPGPIKGINLTGIYFNLLNIFSIASKIGTKIVFVIKNCLNIYIIGARI
jgi:hypothetical protein